MHRIFCEFGPVTIYWYGVCMALGFVIGYGNWVVLGRKRGWTYEILSDMLFWIMVAGIAGARLAYVCSDFGYFLRNPLEIVRVDQGGLIFYGGAIGCIFALWVFARRRHKRFLNLLDLAVSSLPLAHAFGRIGCFLNGCCYGRIWDSHYAVHYPAHSVAWSEQVNAGILTAQDAQSLGVHPVQLYEMAYNLLLYAVLFVAFKKRTKEGQVVVAYLIIYGVGRFALEFLRGHSRLFWLALSVAQWVSLSFFVSGIALLYFIRRNGRPVPPIE